MTSATYRVQAEWDEDGEMWIATSEDISGLVLGGRDLDDVVRKLRLVVPHLVETCADPNERGMVHFSARIF